MKIIAINAVMTQIYTALISILILKYIKLKSSFNWSMSNLGAVLRMNLFTYKDLWEWIDASFTDTSQDNDILIIQEELTIN